MKRYRQWLAETEDHMMESPDGKWTLYAEALADIEAAVKEITESRDEWKRQWRLMEAAEKKAEEQIAALTAENRRLEEEMVKLKEELISRREYRFVDATPNGDLPVRILSAYIEDVFTTDNTVGIPPENPLCKLMNETQEKRNTIIRKAIDALK